MGEIMRNAPSLSSSQGQIRELFILTVAERQDIQAIPAKRVSLSAIIFQTVVWRWVPITVSAGLLMLLAGMTVFQAHALTLLSRSWYARRVSSSRA